MQNILVANRGEIAVRIIRAAQDLGITATAIYAEDDGASLHVQKADQALALQGTGAKAYLDIDQIVSLAKQHGCDAIHPGYGFLSENPSFAQAVADHGLTFIGPSRDTLASFGDKAAARQLAQTCGVPVLAGSAAAVDLAQAQAFMQQAGVDAIVVKAVAGGGGRGMRVVEHPDALEDAFTRAASEAQAAFGIADLYVEQLVGNARHVEVQIIGDGSGVVTHLWERECSAQRRHQKIVEIAPAPFLAAEVRESLCAAAVKLGEHVSYKGLGTIEFLLECRYPAVLFHGSQCSLAG